MAWYIAYYLKYCIIHPPLLSSLRRYLGPPQGRFQSEPTSRAPIGLEKTGPVSPESPTRVVTQRCLEKSLVHPEENRVLVGNISSHGICSEFCFRLAEGSAVSSGNLPSNPMRGKCGHDGRVNRRQKISFKVYQRYYWCEFEVT